MRLWSIHPKYLDSAGLVACWREALLAQKVLLDATKGYKFHPQLIRFRNTVDPMLMIGCYLDELWKEASRRGYHFDRSKIKHTGCYRRLPVTAGQIEFEWRHLLAKLQSRALTVYEANSQVAHPDPHPLFKVVPGDIEQWEKT